MRVRGLGRVLGSRVWGWWVKLGRVICGYEIMSRRLSGVQIFSSFGNIRRGLYWISVVIKIRNMYM